MNAVNCIKHDYETRRVRVAGLAVERRICRHCGDELTRRIIDQADECNDAVRLMAVLSGAEVHERR